MQNSPGRVPSSLLLGVLREAALAPEMADRNGEPCTSGARRSQRAQLFKRRCGARRLITGIERRPPTTPGRSTTRASHYAISAGDRPLGRRARPTPPAAIAVSPGRAATPRFGRLRTSSRRSPPASATPISWPRDEAWGQPLFRIKLCQAMNVGACHSKGGGRTLSPRSKGARRRSGAMLHELLGTGPRPDVPRRRHRLVRERQQRRHERASKREH